MSEQEESTAKKDIKIPVKLRQNVTFVAVVVVAVVAAAVNRARALKRELSPAIMLTVMVVVMMIATTPQLLCRITIVMCAASPVSSKKRQGFSFNSPQIYHHQPPLQSSSHLLAQIFLLL